MPAASTKAKAKSDDRARRKPPRARVAPEPEPAAPTPQDIAPAATWAPLSRLRRWSGNPRKNEGEPVRKVAESIKRFGWGTPMLARADGGLVAGDTRFQAAALLAEQWAQASADERSSWHPDAARVAECGEVVVRFGDWTPEQARLLALADNRLGELAEWDDGALADLLQQHDRADIEIAGWDERELQKLLRASAGGEVDEDDPPPLPKVAITQPGDVWTLGRHRLVCGDCSDAAVVALAMAGQRAACVLTDPPYGVDIAGKNRRVNEIDPGKGGRNETDIEDDALSPEEAFGKSTSRARLTSIRP